MTSADVSRVPAVSSGSKGPTVLAIVLGIVVLIALERDSPRPDDPPHEWSGSTMGTTYSVKVDADIGEAESEELATAIAGVLTRINALMSTYDSASEVSRFNRRASSDPFPISTELVEVLALAQEVSERSDGSFDITVGPLVDAWGFGPSEPGRSPPSEATVELLRERVGSEGLSLDPVARTLAKSHVGAGVDLSAIAKGYAVDRIAQTLEERGLTSFLVEVGGELKAGAPRRTGEAWLVGIEWPDPTVRRLYATLRADRLAIATSGDYRNLSAESERQRTHLIDPRTGSAMPLVGASVSVIHTASASADAWATALSVAGFERGYELAVREGLAALFLRATGNEGIESRATSLFLERATEFTEVGH